ncbi:MAG: aspartate dehydrogenase, partial [Salinibacterium sp.]|nr:aspartate dehydrogenase [Salinibacterium sp.]
MAHRSQPLRVTVLGMGAIGTAVATALASGELQNARLAGVIVRRPDAREARAFPVIDLEEALRSSDLVAECAGVPAVHVEGVRVIEAGID